MSLEDSTTYQGILRKGKGIGLTEALIVIGTAHFGPPSDEVLAVVKSLKDEERLKRMMAHAITAVSWTDLVSVP